RLPGCLALCAGRLLCGQLLAGAADLVVLTGHGGHRVVDGLVGRRHRRVGGVGRVLGALLGVAHGNCGPLGVVGPDLAPDLQRRSQRSKTSSTSLPVPKSTPETSAVMKMRRRNTTTV